MSVSPREQTVTGLLNSLGNDLRCRGSFLTPVHGQTTDIDIDGCLFALFAGLGVFRRSGDQVEVGVEVDGVAEGKVGFGLTGHDAATAIHARNVERAIIVMGKGRYSLISAIGKTSAMIRHVLTVTQTLREPDHT